MTLEVRLLFFGQADSCRKEVFLNWQLTGELSCPVTGLDKTKPFNLQFYSNLGPIKFIIHFLDKHNVKTVQEPHAEQFDGILFFIENEFAQPNDTLENTLAGINYLKQHFSPKLPLQLLLFRFRSEKKGPPDFLLSALKEAAKKLLLLPFIDAEFPSAGEEALLQLARSVSGQPELVFVEAPALAPPEITLDPAMLQQYEAELQNAQLMGLPDEDDDDFGAPSVAVGGSSFQLDGYSSMVNPSGLWSHGSPLSQSGGVQIPLQETEVRAEVLDAVSKVTVYQVFVNGGSTPLENISFCFPIDAMAAVCGFEAKIGDTRVRGKVQEKEEARRIYSQAVQQKKVALKLEEQKPDVFTTSLGNIPPGTKVVIKIDYVVELQMEGESALRFVIPRKIAPRYTPLSITQSSQSLVDQSTATENVTLVKLTILISILMSNNISNLHSIGYPATISYTPVDHSSSTSTSTQNAALVTFDSSSAPHILQSEQDFILLIYVDPQSHPTLWLVPPPPHSTQWAAMATYIPNFTSPVSTSGPPSLLTKKSNSGPRVELIFLVDCSGSMGTTTMAQASGAVLAFLDALPQGEESGVFFNIVKFGDRYHSLFLSSVPASPENIRTASAFVSSLKSDMGGTEILSALHHILNTRPHGCDNNLFSSAAHSHPRQLFVLTDGEVTNTEEVFQCIRRHRDTTRVFAFGVGPNPSRHLVLGMARAGDGKAEFVLPGELLKEKVLRQLHQAMLPSITNVQVDWNIPSGVQHVQAPFHPGTLYPRSRLVVYALFDSCPADLHHAVLRVTRDNHSHVLPLIRTTYSPPPSQAADSQTMIHTLAARSIIRDMEEGTSQFHGVVNNGNISQEFVCC
eukprot:TRINITY_DN4500_c0_g1_i2.p1 TRINITY_DN4500_c0_g1~~TRINITY_DN4500_c0_g1_i2.p1  ORF type:complete len:853 (-),score=212.36 TRINITY_DN4500_c0_g1_i2:490-3048(-)